MEIHIQSLQKLIVIYLNLQYLHTLTRILEEKRSEKLRLYILSP